MTMSFPDAVETQNDGGRSEIVFLCDHARFFIPPALDNLGVAPDLVATHIGWDIGIEGVTRILSDRMRIPAVYCLYSRLILDVNRALDHPELIREESDKILIPGNRNLSDEARQARIDGIFMPFHNAAQAIVERARLESDDKTIVIGMHSCTPMLREEGTFRPWHIGLSTYDSEAEMEALALALESLGFTVGRHEPYDMRDLPGASLDRHAREKGLRQILVEIRQDLIGDAEGQEKWADNLSKAFSQAFNLADIFA